MQRGSRLFKKRGMGRLENLRGVVTWDQEMVRLKEDRVEKVGWMVSSSQR